MLFISVRFIIFLTFLMHQELELLFRKCTHNALAMLMKAVWNMYGEERDCSARIIYLNVQCSEPPNIFGAQLQMYVQSEYIQATFKSFKYQETIIVKLKMFNIDNLAFYPMLVHPNLMFHNFLKWPITFDTNCRSFAASLHFLLPEFHITSTRSLAPVLHFSTEMAFL